MPEPFSYHMATAYQKAFKEFLTYTRLYETLDNEQPYSKSNSFTSREIFERRDSSGILRQHRTKLVRKVRSQIFRQIAQKFRRHTAVWQGISGQYDGKSARRLRTKPSGGLCAVLP